MNSEEKQLQEKRDELVNDYAAQLDDVAGHQAAFGSFVGQAVNLQLEHNITVEEAFEHLLSARQKAREMVEKV